MVKLLLFKLKSCKSCFYRCVSEDLKDAVCVNPALGTKSRKIGAFVGKDKVAFPKWCPLEDMK
jgi:hypothetical protein